MSCPHSQLQREVGSTDFIQCLPIRSNTQCNNCRMCLVYVNKSYNKCVCIDAPLNAVKPGAGVRHQRMHW